MRLTVFEFWNVYDDARVFSNTTVCQIVIMEVFRAPDTCNVIINTINIIYTRGAPVQ